MSGNQLVHLVHIRVFHMQRFSGTILYSPSAFISCIVTVASVTDVPRAQRETVIMT